MARIQKMIDYISEEDTCRSAYLLEYFGQKESADCGTCDVCRSTRKMSAGTKSDASEDIPAELIRFINEEMSGTYALDDIMRRFGSPASIASSVAVSPYMTILRRLIDRGQVPPPQD